MKLKNAKVLLAAAIVIATVALTFDITMSRTSASMKPVAAPPPVTPYSCIPTCTENDGKMLALAGDQFFTFAGGKIFVSISSPAVAPNVEIGIFDGDLGGLNWDDLTLSSNSADLEYKVYADPAQTGSEAGLALVPGPGSMWLDDDEPNNAWSSHIFANTAASVGVGGNHYYLLVITYTDPTDPAIGSFKLRTDGEILLKSQALSFIGALFTPSDFATIYPNFPVVPPFTPTTYDGMWEFNIVVPPGADRVELWDGEFDRGKFDGTDADTDDPNTVGIPPFAGPGTNAEGAAGSLPSDDSVFEAHRRSPSIFYQLIAPNNDTYTNNNPSGTQEWELFSVGKASVANRDVPAGVALGDNIPSGIWKVKLSGVDMFNLNAIFFLNDLAGVCDDGSPQPCSPPGGGEGCTPGYWKQSHHFDSWVGYTPAQKYNTVFGVTAGFATNPSLLQGLEAGGGGERALARHAVAALLSASSPGVNYLFTPAQVIALVQQAYLNGTFESIKNQLAAENERLCRLN